MPARAPVVITASDPRWPARFAEARADILRAVAPYAVAVEHVGSTAVPGLDAKPIIDLALALRRFPDDLPAIVAPLADIGFAHVPKPYADRAFFRRGPWGDGTHHLHVVAAGGEEWGRLLRFRDRLRADPVAAARYAALKRQLAAAFGADRQRYGAEKAAFVAALLADSQPGGHPVADAPPAPSSGGLESAAEPR